jgi:hypothetical protein
MSMNEPRSTSDSRNQSLTLEQLFGAATDELAVLSVCAARPGTDDDWILAHGSLLIVPEACATISWPEWDRQQGRQHGPGIDPPLKPSLSSCDERWLLARQVCGVDEVEEWLGHLWRQSATEDVVCLPQLGCVPELQAHLEMPKALARVVPNIDSPCSCLISGLARPVQALMWGSPNAPKMELPGQIEIDGRWSFLPSRDLAGIHLTPDWVDPKLATAKGLLVGRAERRAWLRDSRGEGEFRRYIVELGWDPSRIDIADLEITHIERMNLDTVLASRVRLEDLDIAGVAQTGSVAIELPTLGRKVTHELALYSLDGELLDQSGPYPIIERVGLTLEINGERQPPVISGITDPPPELQARIERRDEVRTELKEVIESAAQARILADRSIAIERLKDLLKRARGELLVMDRYFGQDVTDWRLLDGVTVPVRVLTGKLARTREGEVVKATLGAQVEARFRPKAPIHDRIYTWEGGGISIGGSPTSFGQAPLRIARLSASESDLWRPEFETLWQSPFFSPVPRSDPPD